MASLKVISDGVATAPTDSGESFQEQFDRLWQMSMDDGETWDLSPNDQRAIEAVLQSHHRLYEALKVVKVVVRPWIDRAIGRPGTVTFAEWDAACEQIEAAISKAEGR